MDVGLFTNQLEPGLAFWSGPAGLSFDHMLPTGGGSRQHRHDMNGSVLKMNHARDPLPTLAPSGYRRLEIASDAITAAQQLRDPDGNEVWRVPRGEVEGIRITVSGASRERFDAFYGEILQLEQAGAAWRCGDSLIQFELDPEQAPWRDTRLAEGEMRSVGYRYLTVQVWDVHAEHAGILARGGIEGRAPLTLGDVASISFVRDLDGNWIEISQRRSLTGTLAED